MILSAIDIRDVGIFKYYRLVRRFMSKNYKLTEPELELLVTMNCVGKFTKQDFIDQTYLISWDKKRWARLRRDGWIDVWREGDNSMNKKWIYRTSRKCNSMINRMYNILLGNEDIPSSIKSPYYKNKTYTDKVMNTSIDLMYRDNNKQ